MQEDTLTSKIIIGVMGLYFIVASLLAVYYNWLFAVENGFITWLLLGWFIPIIQALFWPIDLLLAIF